MLLAYSVIVTEKSFDFTDTFCMDLIWTEILILWLIVKTEENHTDLPKCDVGVGLRPP